jgi:hypothetical protein
LEYSGSGSEHVPPAKGAPRTRPVTTTSDKEYRRQFRHLTQPRRVCSTSASRLSKNKSEKRLQLIPLKIPRSTFQRRVLGPFSISEAGAIAGAETAGDKERATISAAITISATPIALEIPCLPSAACSHENSGLFRNQGLDGFRFFCGELDRAVVKQNRAQTVAENSAANCLHMRAAC